MANMWEKVVDKAVSIKFRRKLIICGTCRRVRWWEEELHQHLKDRRPACFAQGLNKNNN